MEETFYKIYDPINKLYSTGGSVPNWTKRGKIWKTIGNLKNHLNQIDERHKYPNCVEIQEHKTYITRTIDLDVLYDEMKKSKIKREIEYQERIKKYKKQRDMEELKRIASEYNLNIIL